MIKLKIHQWVNLIEYFCNVYIRVSLIFFVFIFKLRWAISGSADLKFGFGNQFPTKKWISNSWNRWVRYFYKAKKHKKSRKANFSTKVFQIYIRSIFLVIENNKTDPRVAFIDRRTRIRCQLISKPSFNALIRACLKKFGGIGNVFAKNVKNGQIYNLCRSCAGRKKIMYG